MVQLPGLGWGHQDPPSLLGISLWLQGQDSQLGSSAPDTAWPQSIPMERKKITFIRLCIKLMYWCYAAALGIEKNGKV